MDGGVHAVSNIEAKTVANKIVVEWICRYGCPSIIHSDQGRQFEGKLFSQLCSLLGIHKTRTTALRPQANGQVERFNKTLGALLAINCDGDPRYWDKHLPFVVAAYRAAVHDSTGVTPNKLMFGHEVMLPLHIITGNPNKRVYDQHADEYVAELTERLNRAYALARAMLKKASRRRKKYYDVGTKRFTLSVGQPVWLYDPIKNEGLCRKLSSLWKKGWVVTHQLDDVRYRIQERSRGNSRIVHIDRLLPYEVVTCRAQADS